MTSSTTTATTATLVALSLALVALLAAPSQASAQTKGQRAAGELAGAAQEAFGEGEFEKAAKLLEQAYAQFPEPNFVWNMARAFELAGNQSSARKSYDRFTRLEVSEEERTSAFDKIARITGLLEGPDILASAQDAGELAVLRSSGAGDKPLPVVEPTEGGGGVSPLALAGWGSTGLGVIALGTTLTLHLASLGTVEEYNAAAASGETNKYNALKDTLNTRVVTSQVLLGSGIILLGTGLTILYFEYDEAIGEWFALGGDDKGGPSIGVAPVVDHERAGVGVFGRF